jgi:lysophospholipase L1-like esterase
MPSRPPSSFQRYVALGDSSTEGVDDPDGNGGYRGWSQRLAEKIAAAQGQLLYANLASRGLTTEQVHDLQLEPALALRPDLATVFCGTNDVTAPRFDAVRVAEQVEHMQRTLIAHGATVLTFTLPDLTPLMPLARLIAPRIRALNHGLAAASRRTGAVLVDFASLAFATDPRLWSEDRIHANAEGHRRIAEALAEALQLPGSAGTWRQPLPPLPQPTAGQRCVAELRWIHRHLAPWAWIGLTSRFGTIWRPKQPHLLSVTPAGK